MSMDRISESPTLNQQVKALLEQLDDYDDPCFLLLYSDLTPQQRAASLTQVFLSEGMHDCPVIHLDEQVSFSSVFCDSATAQVIADELVESLQNNAYLSVFRHNCLSKPLDTFDWTRQQLMQLIEGNEQGPHLAINDFQDKANWPGISQYLKGDKSISTTQAEPEVEAVQPKPSLWQRVKLSVNRALRSASANKHEEQSFALTPALVLVEPFILALPQGKALWHYVLTGAGKQELVQSQGFLDLDHILFLPHAYHHARPFYTMVMENLRYDALPEQNDLQHYFFRAIFELVEELLEAEQQTKAKQACFLRLLDIFYHMFDQQPWPEDIYDMLVEDEDTACLTDEDYQSRYTETPIEQESGVSARTQQSIIELLDRLEDYHFASYRDKATIDKLFAEQREPYHPDVWQSTEPTSRLLLASILLFKDRQNGIDDEQTKALQGLVQNSLLEQTVKQIKSELSYGNKLPESWLEWLSDDKQEYQIEHAESLKPLLSGDIGLDADRTEQTPQPHYQLYSNISDFQPVLASCFWLQLSYPSTLSQKVIKLSLAIAPQSAISCFANLSLAAFGGFTEKSERRQCLRHLESAGVGKYDLLSFNIRVAQSSDIKWYEKLVRQYIKAKQQERLIWDIALSKVNPSCRDNFYLDVHRLGKNIDTPLLSYRQDMLKEVISHTMYMDDDFFAAQFAPEQVLFSDHVEFLPEAFHRPVVRYKGAMLNHSDAGFVVLRANADALELLVDNPNSPFAPEQQNYPVSSHFIILSEQADLAKVFALVKGFQPYQQRADSLLIAMQRYITGTIDYQTFQQDYAGFIELKALGIQIERYCKYSPRILPQILAEPDKDSQLRMIKLLCAHKTRGKRVFKQIAEQMFFDHHLAKKNVDFATRHDDLSVDELVDEWVKPWQKYLSQLEQELKTAD